MKYLLAAILYIAIAFSGNAQSPGFFLDDWEPKEAEIPLAEETEKPVGDPSTTITVDITDTINKVPKYIYGNNAVTWTDDLSYSSTGMKDLKNLNPHVLRWPGGSLSNVFFWNVPYGQRPADVPDYIVEDHGIWYGGPAAEWQTSIEEYYQMLNATNSTGSICVNYGYARYGTGPDPVATAAHMAAEWVRYDNGRSKFWEIGNENFGSWESSYEIETSMNQDGQPRMISGELYGKHCRVFIDSMRAAAAEIGVEIYIGVVTYDAETSHDQISEDWNEGMMPEVGHLADFLIVHSYFTPYNQDSNVGTILNSHVVPGNIYNAAKADMAEAGQAMLPIAMTEWNIFATGSMQQVSYVNGMLAAITLGEYVKNDYGLSTRWDLTNGWSDGNDHGMFSVGGEPGVDPLNPRPVFFYMYYHQKFFGDHMVHSTVSGNEHVVAHASTFSSGETGLVVVNKSSDAEVIEIDFAGDHVPGLNYYYYTLTGGTDNGDFSRKVLINGEETDEEGGGPDNYEEIKAFKLPARDGIMLNLPPRGATYVMIEKRPPFSLVYASINNENKQQIKLELTDDILEVINIPAFQVTLNGETTVDVLSVERDLEDAYMLLLNVDYIFQSDDEVKISYSGTGVTSSKNEELETFSNTNVENLIPGGPYVVEVVTMDANSGEIVSGVNIEMNTFTATSNDQGIAAFSLLEGAYAMVAFAENYDSLMIEEYNIYSDTLINLNLEPAKYEVEFQCVDSLTREPIQGVIVSSDNFFMLSNSDGEVSVDGLNAGNLQFNFSKTGYQERSFEIVITSDMLIEVALLKTHSAVKFRIRDGESPVVNALVIVGNDSLYSSLVGTCLFEHVKMNEQISYSVFRANYYDLEGELLIQADTVITLQMDQSVGNIEFTFEGDWDNLQNTIVVVAEDTVIVEAEKPAKFYNMPLMQAYSYIIQGDYYADRTGSIYLESDTVINISYTGISTREDAGDHILVYPNPVSNLLYVKSTTEAIQSVRITDITGKICYYQTYRNGNDHLTINPDLKPGNYFISVTTGTRVKTTHLIVMGD